MSRVYRALLRLYPGAFRRDFGDDMVAIFEQRAAGAGAGRRVALLFGALPEIVSNASALHWELLRQDLAYASRTVRRAPLFAVAVVLITALGVGANTAAFSVANFVLVQPLPYPESEAVVRLCEGPVTGAGWGCNNQLSPDNYRDFKEQTTTVENLGLFSGGAVDLVGGGEPERISRTRVTDEVFPALGVTPLLGSAFGNPSTASEDAAVVLSYGLWQSRFGGDPGVLGQSVSLDGTPHVVIGVMPRGFYFPSRADQLWTRFELTEDDFGNRNNTYLDGIGRLRDGVSFEEATADLQMIAERLRRLYPETNAETGISFYRLRDGYSPRFRQMVLALCGASLCILVLACANLANLMLARAGARERELAVRSALGAGKERLARQIVTESAALVLVGGATGVAIAVLALPLLALMVPATIPIEASPGLDLRMLGFAGGFTLVTGLGCGLLPSLRAGGRAGLDALRTGARSSGAGQQRRRAVLVSVQVAASVVLLVSSGLLLRAVLRVQNVDPGFDPEAVLTLRTELTNARYDSLASRREFYQRVLTRVRVLPGVRSAAYMSGLPMVMTGGIATVVLPGQEIRPPTDRYLVSRRYATSGLFAAMGIPLVAGRDLEDSDAPERGNVAVVSESFAARYWPGDVALGKVFLFQEELRTVVGVVADVRVRGLERESEPQMYLPFSAIRPGFVSIYDPQALVVRTSGPPTAVLSAVREVIRSVDPELPISSVRTLEDVVAGQTELRRAQVRVLAALAALALLLAGVGIYGLLAFTVAQRQREIGVRLALGAEPGLIARRVIWDGVRLVLVGVLPGLLIAYWAARSMSALLFGVPPADPTTMAIAVGLCTLTALVGATVPALRAVRVSPLTVIQAE